MPGRQTLSLDYETELPPQQVTGQPFQLATSAQIFIAGTVDPATAARAFDPEGKLDAAKLAHTIKENMRGWLRYTATAALKKLLERPGSDPLEPVARSEQAAEMMRQALTPILGQWTFEIHKLEITYSVTQSTMTALPRDLRQRLLAMARGDEQVEESEPVGPVVVGMSSEPQRPDHSPTLEVPPVFVDTTDQAEGSQDTYSIESPDETAADAEEGAGEADTAAAFGPFMEEIEVDIPPQPDPVSGTMAKARAKLTAAYTADPERIQESVGDGREIDIGQAAEMLGERILPWLEYAAKQAFYNALYRHRGQDPSSISDPVVMSDRAVDLCWQGLAELGVLNIDIQLSYQPLDDPTAAIIDGAKKGSSDPPPSPARDRSGRGEAVVAGAIDTGPPEAPETAASAELGVGDTIAADSLTGASGTGAAGSDVSGVESAATQAATWSQQNRPGHAIPIEEAVWKHQKAIATAEPHLSRRQLAARILKALADDGYPAEERSRIGRLIGADSQDLA